MVTQIILSSIPSLVYSRRIHKCWWLIIIFSNFRSSCLKISAFREYPIDFLSLISELLEYPWEVSFLGSKIPCLLRWLGLSITPFRLDLNVFILHILVSKVEIKRKRGIAYATLSVNNRKEIIVKLAYSVHTHSYQRGWNQTLGKIIISMKIKSL